MKERTFYILSILQMLDLEKVSTFQLPKEKKILDCEDWYFTVSETGTIKMYKENSTAPETLKAKQQEILELESQLENWQLNDLEYEETSRALRKAESEYNYLSEPFHLCKDKCKWIENLKQLEQWKELAQDAGKNTVYSVAYATGWRHPETPIEDLQPLPNVNFFRENI